MHLNKIFYKNKKFLKLFNNSQIAAFIVPIDPEQTYYPKISSKILKSGYIISNSLDKMSPMLNNKIENKLNII